MTEQQLRRVVARVLALSIAGLGGGGAFAQDTAAGTRASAAGLEEVIVQAQRREQSLQDVPMSIAAFTPQDLGKVAPVTIEDLNNLIPNTELEHVGLFRSAASFSMRGVGTSGIESFADPAVAVFINGVYQARNATALSSTLDIEAIEVMRGPQGTIYGRNAYAGAIVLRTNRPEMNQPGGYGRLNLGNYGAIDADIVANLPLIQDTLAGRIAVRSHQNDGYYRNSGVIDNLGTVDPNLKGDNITAEKNMYIRPSLRFTPGENLDMTLFAEIFRDRSDAGVGYNQTYDPQAVTNALCGAVASPPAPGTGLQCPISVWETLGYPGHDPWGDGNLGIPGDGSDPWVVGQSLSDRPQDMDSYNYTLETNYHTGHGTYTLTLNYGDVEEEIWSDTDGENVNLFSSARWQDYDTYSAEGHFVSDFSDKIDFIGGVFYLHDKYITGQVTFPTGQPAIPVFVTTLPNLAYGFNSHKRDSWAVYAQAEWHWTQALSLVAGGRYSYEKKYDAVGQPILNIQTTGLPPTSDWSSYPRAPNIPVFGPISDDWSNFAPRVGVNYKLNDDIFLFAFWQRAFKSGGLNMNAGNAEVFNLPFGEEQVDNYEAGIKSEWLDNRLRVNANFFYSQYKDVQRNILRPSSTAAGVITFTDNAADIDAYGVELEISAAPTDSLRLYANVGYLDASYASFCAELDGAETSPTPQSGRRVCGTTTLLNTPSPFRYLVEVDHSDLDPVRAPEWDVTVGGTKDFHIGTGTLSFDANYSYTAEMYTDLLNRPQTDRRPLDVVNASLAWNPDDDRYSIVLWGKNLTDNVERLNVAMVANLFAFANATAPRTYGVSVQVNF